MDPLVEAYAKLDSSKGEVVEAAIMEKSVVETRKFLIEIGLSSLLLLGLSTLSYL